MRSFLIPFLLLLACLFSVTAQARSTAPSGAPYSGLESSSRHAFGPDIGESARRRQPPQAFSDAYGNPVTGQQEEAVPHQRPSAGAYGGYGRGKTEGRPLPQVEGPARWNFGR